jgi:hypothetical protein
MRSEVKDKSGEDSFGMFIVTEKFSCSIEERPRSWKRVDFRSAPEKLCQSNYGDPT